MAASVIESHPKRKEIIDAILSGASLRNVADRYGISNMAVHRYKKNVVAPAVLGRPLHPQVLGANKLATEAVAQVTEARNVAQSAIALAPVLQRIQARAEKREKLLEAAGGDKDYRGFAALDTCEHRDIRLECELTGLLQNQQAPSTVINLVCAQVDISAAPVADEGEVLDISPVPQDT